MNTEPQAVPYQVAPRAVVSVEHPCVVKNVDRAIEMLGGAPSISEVLQPDADCTLALKFSPENLNSRPILSFNNKTSNVLLRIQIPLKIGKRKRGSDGPITPMESGDNTTRDANYLLHSLRDNQSRSTVEVVGHIHSSHVFRTSPDFVYNSNTSKFLSEVHTKINSNDFEKISSFKLPRTYGLQDTEALPPPIFTTTTLPQYYSYHHTANLKNTNAGPPVRLNKDKVYLQHVKEMDPSYPAAPRPDIPPLEASSIQVQRLVPAIRRLFNIRPIWSRRALLNRLSQQPDLSQYSIRFALAYVAFTIRSGPWHESLCRFGVDPRQSPAYRQYQTVGIQLTAKGKNIEAGHTRSWVPSAIPNSHVFKGSETIIPKDGKIWQLCDLMDPQLKVLVDVADEHLRTECDRATFGWYKNGTIAKVRVLLKAKVEGISSGEPYPDQVFSRILQLPETVPDRTISDELDQEDTMEEREFLQKCYLNPPTTKDEARWSSDYRSLARLEKIVRSYVAKIPEVDNIVNDSGDGRDDNNIDSQVDGDGARGSDDQEDGDEDAADDVMNEAQLERE